MLIRFNGMQEKDREQKGLGDRRTPHAGAGRNSWPQQSASTCNNPWQRSGQGVASNAMKLCTFGRLRFSAGTNAQ